MTDGYKHPSNTHVIWVVRGRTVNMTVNLNIASNEQVQQAQKSWSINILAVQ